MHIEESDSDDDDVQKIMEENDRLRRENSTMKKEMEQKDVLIAVLSERRAKLEKEVAILRQANLEFQESKKLLFMPDKHIIL